MTRLYAAAVACNTSWAPKITLFGSNPGAVDPPGCNGRRVYTGEKRRERERYLIPKVTIVHHFHGVMPRIAGANWTRDRSSVACSPAGLFTKISTSRLKARNCYTYERPVAGFGSASRSSSGRDRPSKAERRVYLWQKGRKRKSCSAYVTVLTYSNQGRQKPSNVPFM